LRDRGPSVRNAEEMRELGEIGLCQALMLYKLRQITEARKQ